MRCIIGHEVGQRVVRDFVSGEMSIGFPQCNNVGIVVIGWVLEPVEEGIVWEGSDRHS